MRKKSRAIALAMAGALAVSNFAVILNPLTAYAAGTSAVGDVITFTAGSSGKTLLGTDVFPNPITLVASDASSVATGEAKISATLPSATDALTDDTITNGYQLVWNDGTNDLVAGVATYSAITSKDNKATLAAAIVAKKMTLEWTLGNGETKEDTPKTFGTNISKIADPTYAGYTFAGWDLDNTPATIEIEPGKTAAQQSAIIDNQFAAGGYVDGSAIAMQAVWTANDYVTTYDLNGGTSTDTVLNPTTTAFTALGTTKVPAVDTSKTTKKGYDLVEDKEWTLSSSGDASYGYKKNDTTLDKVYNNGANATALEKAAFESGKATLYLNWKEHEYTLTLDTDNTGTNLNADVFLISKKNSANKWTQAGGINTDVTGTIPYKGQITLPTLTDAASPIAVNNEMVIEKTGTPDVSYEFEGWTDDVSTAAKASKATYFPGDTVTIDQDTPANITLYPVFKEANIGEYDVTFAVVGGSDVDNFDDVPAGTTITLPTTTKEGFTFDGWTATSDGKKYLAGASYEVTADESFTAAWTEHSYTVKYYEGTTLLKTEKVRYTTDTLTFPTPSAANVIGWSKTDGNTDPEIVSTTGVKELTATDGATISLYAIIATDPTTFAYADNNEGAQNTMYSALPTAPAKVNKNSSITLKAPTLVQGYDFVGWTEDDYATEKAASDAHATIYKAGSKYQIKEAAVTLYPLCKERTLTVKFDGNGSTSGSVADMSVTFDGTNYTVDKLNKNAFAKDGFTFVEWDDVKASGGNVYADEYSGNLTVADDSTGVYTVYAQWEANEYKLAFDANGGTGTMNPWVVDANDATPLVNGFTPADPSVTFIGWALDPASISPDFSDSNTAGDVIDSQAATLENGGTVTIYAVWQETDAVQKAKEEAEEAKEEADAAKEEADAAKEAEEAAKADADAAKKDADAAKADAEKANADADAAKKDADAAKEDAANQKAAAEKANADADAAKKDADAAKAELAKVPKAQENVVAETGEKVDTYADGTAVLKEIPETAIVNGKYTAPTTVKVAGKEFKVTKLGRKAIYKNKKVKNVTIPENITEIDKLALALNPNLKVVRIKGKDVVIRKNAFKKMNKKGKILVRDKDTKENVKAKGGQPKSVKVKTSKK